MLPLTRELAQSFSSMRAVPGERPLREARLKYFRNHLRDQTFNSPFWAKAILGGVEYRADGQHTSTVLATCDDAVFPPNLAVTVTTYQIDGKDDLAPLFDLFDHPHSARTNADKLGIYIADYADLLPLDRAFLNRVADGLGYYYRDAINAGLEHITVFQQREHGMYFNEELHRMFAFWLYPLREVKHGWMIGKPGIAAEIFADWKNHRELAERFWTEVMTESNPDVEDETRELATTLRDWVKKQPRVKQERFRSHAHKIFDRYRRAHMVARIEPASVPPVAPPAAA